MMIEKKIQDIKDSMLCLPGWEDRYEYIISLGQQLRPFSEKYKTDRYLLRGCQSRVWLREYEEEKKIYFEADSDALITKGILALLLSVVSGHTRHEILSVDFGWLDEIGLKSHLSMARVNGLFAMIQRLQKFSIQELT